ncbi:hypothetical protein QYM36_019034 [Artemia franciscana]|uniref:Uncharacterized protein n=1 Tax=Artemia franciscana TaxID=6661 RepID=A0AA88H8H0_ARTSF|nr:hypothetical protein QYM36_019034 [Artemia franciscana]
MFLAKSIFLLMHQSNYTLIVVYRAAYEVRNEIVTKLADYVKLKDVLKALKDTGMTGKPLKMQVDIGDNFYVHAKV